MKRHNIFLAELSILVIIMLFAGLDAAFSQSMPLNSGRNFSINLKSKALVLGPKIKLGEIGKIIVPDSLQRLKLSSIELGQAPPPGESTDLSLNYIKRCLKRAGFEEFISYIKGPKTVRVTTAQIEIDKAFLEEGYANLLQFHIILWVQVIASHLDMDCYQEIVRS
ncbi:MAG: hypothetical protein ACE5IW_01655 [bacterium]